MAGDLRFPGGSPSEDHESREDQERQEQQASEGAIDEAVRKSLDSLSSVLPERLNNTAGKVAVIVVGIVLVIATLAALAAVASDESYVIDIEEVESEVTEGLDDHYNLQYWHTVRCPRGDATRRVEPGDTMTCRVSAEDPYGFPVDSSVDIRFHEDGRWDWRERW